MATDFAVTSEWHKTTLAEMASPPHVVGSNFGFTEGPIWRRDRGHWIFSDIPRSEIWSWSADSGLSRYRTPSNKANGNALDVVDRMLTCEHATSRVVRESGNDTLEVLASSYGGQRLNSPNDVVVASDGVVLFTDPTYGLSAEFGEERAQELDFTGLFRINGTQLTLVDDDFDAPNGLCLSPDETYLYVNDSVRRTIVRYRYTSQYVSDRQLFAQPPTTETARPDGMKCDRNGNVWCTGAGGLWIYAPTGDRLGRLKYDGPDVANFAFGGREGRDLLLTAGATVVTIELDRPLAVERETA